MVDAVPYQAYRSKRHSRGLSNPTILVPNVPTPPLSRPASASEVPVIYRTTSMGSASPQSPTSTSVSPRALSPTAPESMSSWTNHDEAAPTNGHIESETIPAISVSPAASESTIATTTVADKGKQPETSPARPRKTSTFRRITPAASRPPLPSSPLRPASAQLRAAPGTTLARPSDAPVRPGADASRTVSSSTIASSTAGSAARPLDSPLRPTDTTSRTTSSTSITSVNPVYKPLPNSPLARPSTQPLPALPIPTRSPAPQLDSLPSPSPSAPSPVRTPSSAPSAPQSPSPSVLGLPRASAPYRPGFQPKGVYRPRTDEFIAARVHTRTTGRVERARLERRLEKLVALHFGPDEEKPKPSPVRPAPASPARRASSFFESIDFSELRSKGAGELWRGVVQSQAVQGSAKEIRAAEQRITPWEEDSSVSACPFCTASFHPLTNRKHHCRMCGRIMCSLPPKAPQRPEPCSILFVADSKTGRIEEVSEGVDYGVRRRQSSTGGDDERFLRGVRICKECRPVLLRQQYTDDRHRKPKFVRLHEALVALEGEIEDDLPAFQELMVALSTGDDAPQEASVIRKRLLDSFAQYDALAKHIQKLPCVQGGSQERVQAAVARRANNFLQKNMFPLQSIPRPRPSDTASPSPQPELEPLPALGIDPDSALAITLQPLLEQEARLESYVAEAGASRRLEDARVLRQNLDEIREEIQRVLAGAS